MNIIIFGGGGFLGSCLATQLLSAGVLAGRKLKSLTLVDKSFPEFLINDDRLACIMGDFGESHLIEKIAQKRPDVIFHMAAVVSGEAEKNFELGMSVNLHASLQLLETFRKLNARPRIVFASSCAVFGGDVRQTITDTTGPKPLSSYGTQKAIVELLMSDYSRKGFVDARSLRLPTIAVRPGKPNAATSSFVSSIIREPLHGQSVTYPVPPETEVWIQSPKKVIQNFIHAAELDEKAIGNNRVVNLPGLTASIKDMISSLEEIAGPEATKLIKHVPDEFLQSIVLTWPPHFDTSIARRLGFVSDESVSEIIKQFIQEEGINIKTK